MGAPSAAVAAIRGIDASPFLASWLQQHQLSLAFSTYRANRLLFLGLSTGGQLKLHERLFDRPLGLFAAGDSLWMAARNQLWRLDNHLAPGLSHEGGDRLYVPAVSLITGDVNAHEVVLDASGQLLFVNTAFSCIAAIEPGCSFAPTWQPPFISTLAADDRCHLNGLALKDGIPTWATACGHTDEPSGWRHDRSSSGVLIHIPSGELAATGLAMPHSPRWHNNTLYLLNSGTGELGTIEHGRFVPLCALPGFTRGLAFAGNTAIVGLSKLRSPQFTGLPLEERLNAEGISGGCCGLRVIDLATGAILHSLDLPDPIDELFDVALLPGVRQPRALGLQAEDIDCLVKLPGRDELVQVRPKAPSGNPHQAPRPPVFGLPPITSQDQEPWNGSGEATGTGGNRLTPGTQVQLRYQQVYQLTPSTLAPYAALTFPSLKPGSNALARLQGELLAVSAMANGDMVGLAIAERQSGGTAALRSLCVDPAWRRQGIGTGLLARLMRFIDQDGIGTLTLHYQASELSQLALEPILRRLGWSQPKTDFLLLEAQADQLAAVPWATKHPIGEPYQLTPWSDLNDQQLQQIPHLDVPRTLLPPADTRRIEPAVSLALLHDGDIVGWILAERLSSNALRYSSFFVTEQHRGRARAAALLANAFARQQQAAIPVARAAIADENRAMVRLIKRHLKNYLNSMGRSRRASFQSRGAAA